MNSTSTRQALSYVLVFIGLISCSVASAQSIRYVKPVSSGLGNGTSWLNASNDLQLVIQNSSSGDQIWVAAGTYKPARRADDLTVMAVDENDVQRAFVMKEGVKIYGSFVGTETLLSQRVLPTFNENTTYSSILSGDFLGDDIVEDESNDTDNAPFTILNIEENACHVVIFAGPITPNTILDGFSITGGNAETRFTQPEIIVNENSIITSVGGGINLVSASPTLSNIRIHHNCTSGGGGGLYLESSSPIMSNIISEFNRSTGSGGGMYNDNSSPNISNIKLSYNFAWVQGAGLFNGYNSNLTVSNGVISNNISFLYGGGVMNVNSTPTFTNTTINSNSALDGGGIHNFNSGVILTNVNLLDNSCGGSGGGMYSQSSTGINLNNVTVTGNSAANSLGGGLTFTYNSTASLLNCSITENSNGGLYIAQGASITVNGGSISNNLSDVGAGIYNESTLPSHFTDMEVNNNTNGGIFNNWSSSTFTNIVVSGNQGGAGIAVGNASPILTNMTITNNTSPGAGGGISIGSATPTISFCTVENNSAADGGGISISNSTVNLSNVSVSNNVASGNGGGIYSNTSNSTFANVTVQGNTAPNGGGLFNRRSNPVMTNILITGNYSLGRGGGIYNNQSSPIITNATISGNSGMLGYGAMYNETFGIEALPTNPIIRNSIMWDNSSGINMGCTTCNPVISYSLIQSVTVAGVNNNFASDTNPLFINAPDFSTGPFTTGNYYLQSSSPVINAGNNLFFAASQIPDLSMLGTDLDGNQRIQENTIDLGAYENNSSLGVENISSSKFKVYPNPVKDVAQIKSPTIFEKVEIHDSMGRMVRSQNIDNNSIDMSGIAAGIYIVSAYSDGNKVINIKVVKQ